MSANIQHFENESYLNLETYKKNGQQVITPVWFVIKDKVIFIVTRENTGKVKRIKNNNSVRINPCNFRGVSKGSWISGIANFVNSTEYEEILKLRYKKYGIKSKIASLFSKSKGNYIIISIKVE